MSVFLGSFAGDYYGRQLNRRERARFQRDLEERAYDLRAWAIEMEERDAFLDNRRPRIERITRRYALPPARRLSSWELFDWDDRLRRQAIRLDDLDRSVSHRERRRGGAYCPPRW